MLLLNSVSLLWLQQHKWHSYQYCCYLLPVSALSLFFITSHVFVCCCALVSVIISDSVTCSPCCLPSLSILQTGHSLWCKWNKSTILPYFRCSCLHLVMQVVLKNTESFHSYSYLRTLTKQKHAVTSNSKC